MSVFTGRSSLRSLCGRFSDCIQALVDCEYRVIPSEVHDHEHMTYIISKFTTTSDYHRRLWIYLLGIGVKPDTRSANRACSNLNLPLLKELVEEWYLTPSPYSLSRVMSTRCDDLYSVVATCIKRSPDVVVHLPRDIVVHVATEYCVLPEVVLTEILTVFTSYLTHTSHINAIARCISFDTKLDLINDPGTDANMKIALLRNMDEV